MKIKVKSVQSRDMEQGFVLIFGLIIMSSFLLLVLPFLSQMSNEYKLSERASKSQFALVLAEAGAEMAIWEIDNGDITKMDSIYQSLKA